MQCMYFASVCPDTVLIFPAGTKCWQSWEFNLLPSRPQSLRSFWPVVGIESSGLVQNRKSAIHGLPVKSSKSDWLRMRNEYSAHAQKIGSGQSSRSQPQARRIVGSGDENEFAYFLVQLKVLIQMQNLKIFWQNNSPLHKISIVYFRQTRLFQYR